MEVCIENGVMLWQGIPVRWNLFNSYFGNIFPVDPATRDDGVKSKGNA